MSFAELTDGYKLTYDKFGISGQRQFIEFDENSGGPSSSGVTIPVIGSLFHNPIDDNNTEWKNCFCVKIDQQYVMRDKRKLLVTCYYSNEPIDPSNMALDSVPPKDPSELPQEFDYSGEYQVWTPNKLNTGANNWVWADTNIKIAQSVPFRVRTMNYKISRIISTDSYDPFRSSVMNLLGKVNNREWMGQKEGSWLFVGARSEMFNDQQSKNAYKFELTFSFRDPDGTGVNGWQKIMSIDTGLFRLIKLSGTLPEDHSYENLYESGDFAELFQDSGVTQS